MYDFLDLFSKDSLIPNKDALINKHFITKIRQTRYRADPESKTTDGVSLLNNLSYSSYMRSGFN